MKKQIFILMIALALTGFELQAQHNHGHAGKKGPASKSAQAADPAFQKHLAAIFEASQNLKEALVASDAAKAKTAATAVEKSLAATDMNLLKGQAQMQDWMDHQKTLKSTLGQISGTANLSEQRKHFAQFSEALFQSAKAFGIGGTEAYYQYCPMALDNAGAYWLSDSKEIRNPYFGQKMLKCGENKETLN